MQLATPAMQEDDKALSGDLSARLRAARENLRGRMAAAGCHESDGWRIHEELANSPSGTQFVLRPVHRVHTAPANLAVSIPVTS